MILFCFFLFFFFFFFLCKVATTALMSPWLLPRLFSRQIVLSVKVVSLRKSSLRNLQLPMSCACVMSAFSWLPIQTLQNPFGHPWRKNFYLFLLTDFHKLIWFLSFLLQSQDCCRSSLLGSHSCWRHNFRGAHVS